MDPVQNNQNQSNNTNPNIDTSSADGSALPFPVGGDQPQAVTPQTTTTTTTVSGGSPVTPPPADATGGNTPTVNETPPPPSNGSVVATVKPTRGKFGPTGLIATVFGVLLLVGATLAGVLLVQQNQDIREKAAEGDSCDYCAGADECFQNTGGSGDGSSRAKAVCGGLNCCQGFHAGSGGGGTSPGGCTGISCGGGECNNGEFFGPDACAPQATCQQRAEQFCATRGGVKTGDVTATPTPPGTGEGPTGGSHSGACTAAELALGTGFTTCRSTDHFAFRSCPSEFCAAGNQAQGCAGVAQALGCYQAGSGNSASCILYKHYKCSGQFGMGDGCQQNVSTSDSLPSLTSPFCGTQQIDCTCAPGSEGCVNESIHVVSNEDRSSCAPGTVPSPTPTDTPGCTGPNCGTTLTASCLNIKAYNTDWVQLTAQELAALQPGTAVRFAVKGSTTNGTFDKARFTINNVLRPEVTTTNPADTQQYYDEYVIPVGVTSFTIGAEVHHASLNTWN